MRHGYTFLNQKVSKRVQYGSILLRFHRQVYDIQGVILNHFVPPKTTVTGNYYATIIKSELLPAIKRKRPHLERSVILLHHHNAPSHSSRIVMDTVNKLGTELLPHPPYSPDLAICDFWLFPNLKNRLLGNKYILLLTHPLPPPKKKKKKKNKQTKKKNNPAYKDDKSNFVIKRMLFAKFQTKAHAAFGRGICHLLCWLFFCLSRLTLCHSFLTNCTS